MPADHELAHWEVAADSIVVALAGKGYFSVDELRRNIENLPGPLYERYMYGVAQVDPPRATGWLPF